MPTWNLHLGCRVSCESSWWACFHGNLCLLNLAFIIDWRVVCTLPADIKVGKSICLHLLICIWSPPTVRRTYWEKSNIHFEFRAPTASLFTKAKIDAFVNVVFFSAETSWWTGVKTGGNWVFWVKVGCVKELGRLHLTRGSKFSWVKSKITITIKR